MLSTFTSETLRLKSVMESRSKRIMLGSNHMMRMFLFTPNNTFFLKDIPEGLTLRGRDTIVDILQTIKGNPRNFKYHGTPEHDSIVFRLSELIKDAKSDERDALSKMSAEAKDLHRKLLKALADLRVKETYHVGAHALYRILGKEPNRELVGDNEPLYGMIFFTKGASSAAVRN